MINFLKYKTILWDFDGVLMDSMPVRDRGFEIVLSSFDKKDVDKLLEYHRVNGGLSRYVKFRYFYENILNQNITDEKVMDLSKSFSGVMRKELLNSKLLINDSLDFVKNKFQDYAMHIVSGSDQEELRYLTKELNIAQFFKSIHGSPTAKKKWVGEILKLNKYDKTTTVLIGDSINDWEAAEVNQISFLGYNNESLKRLGEGYINSFANDAY